MIRSCKRGGEIPKCISSNQNIVNLKTFPKAKKFLFRRSARSKLFCHSPSRVVECVSEYIFQILKNKQIKSKQTNKQKNNNNKNTKKQEKLKNKREYLRENQFKSRRLGEDFCRRPHFRKEEYFFLVQPWWNIHLKIKL